MKITKLQLENFRNYKKFEFEFDSDKNFTLILGENGKGKTNFLEAVYVLSLGRSFRTLAHDELIAFEMDYFRLTGEILDGRDLKNLEIFYSTYPRKQKGLKINDVGLKNSEYLGNLVTVLFQPEDLNMLYLSPILRRKYLNIILSQTDKSYLQALSDYNKSLKQRNALLQSIKESGKNKSALLDDLFAWDKEIIPLGSLLTAKRKNLVDFFDKHLEKTYRSISGNKESVSIEYVSQILKKRVSANPSEIENFYADELFNRKERDIRYGKSTSGPHRDDLKFFINGKLVQTAASRGEFRTLLLALKLIEIAYIKEKTEESPVLLLDDVFSELDLNRRKHLLNAISDCQVIITSTDSHLTEDLLASQKLQVVNLD